MKHEAEKNILKNYNDILDAEINHPEDIMTFDTVEEMIKHFNSICDEE